MYDLNPTIIPYPFANISVEIDYKRTLIKIYMGKYRRTPEGRGLHKTILKFSKRWVSCTNM